MHLYMVLIGYNSENQNHSCSTSMNELKRKKDLEQFSFWFSHKIAKTAGMGSEQDFTTS